MQKFSVLMSVYYREKGEFLKASLGSVFNQTAPPSEVVLVKDGPLTEELDAVVNQFQKLYDTLKVIALPKNVGLGNALNEGIKHCLYDLVARMDSDDVCVNTRFEEQLTVFEQYPDIDIVGGWIEEFDNNFTKSYGIRKLPQTNDQIIKFFKSKSPLNHVTVVFKKTKVLQAGSYQDFYLLEDYWLWGRMVKIKTKFYNVQEVVVHVRAGIEMSTRRGGLKYAKSEIKLQRQFLNMNLISFPRFCQNIIARFGVRMMPNKLRSLIYQKILRK